MLLAIILSQFAFCRIGQNLHIKEDFIDDQFSARKEITATASFTRCTFSDIQVTDLNGGAISVSKATCEIEDCKFNSCSGKNGGAIFVSYTGKNKYSFLVSNSEFSNCQGTLGGAIYIDTVNTVTYYTLNITYCTFTSNAATSNGGALYSKARDALIVENSIFTNNVAQEGSSVYYQMYTNTASGSENDLFYFTNDTFSFEPNENNKVNVYIKGGNVQNVEVANIIISGCTFSASGSFTENILHLSMEDSPCFKSIKFDECNCVKQGRNTFSIPSKFDIENIDFECTSIESCNAEPPEIHSPEEKPDPETPPPEGEYVQREQRLVPTESIKLIRSIFSNLKDTSVDGGAISVNKVTCELEDCKFNSCSGKNGGAIFVSYTGKNKYSFLVSNSEFSNCQGTLGGAIYIDTVNTVTYYTLNITYCTFTSNVATSNGGALYSKARDALIVENSIFTNNAAQEGSSVYYQMYTNTASGGENDLFYFTNDTFSFEPNENNKVNVYFKGGNVKNVEVANIIISGCTFSASGSFTENILHLSMEDSPCFKSIKFDECNCVKQGRNTFSIPSKFDIENIDFECTSIESCNAEPPEIHSPEEKPDPEDPTPPEITPDPGYTQQTTRIENQNTELTLKNVEFNNIVHESTGQLGGGAILIKDPKVNCSIENCKFTLCQCNKFGGAIEIHYEGTRDFYCGSIKNTIFQHCSSKSKGGAVYLDITQQKRHSFSFEGCTFISNVATGNGGAICTQARDLLTVQGCTFTDNKAKAGSSMWINTYGTSAASKESGNSITLSDNKFTFAPTEGSSNVYIETPNQAGAKNANIYLGGCTFSTSTTTDVNFKHFEAVEQGALFESIQFTSCNSVQQGSETISVPDCAYPIKNFDFNHQEGACTPDAEITLLPTPPPDTDGYFSHDRIDGSTLPVVLEKVKFTEQSSDVDGGAIVLNKVELNLTNCKFTKCSARNGGAIHLKHATSTYKCTITSTIFESNTATANGGAIYYTSQQSNKNIMNLYGCTFKSNSANLGGAIYTEARDQLTIDTCKFEDNNATKGSSLWCQIGYYNDSPKGNSANIISCTFEFTPFDGAIDVYVQSYKLKENETENANLYLSLCTFKSTESSSSSYHHLLINSESDFESINFPHCVCVGGSDKTVSIPADVDVSNINYDCNGMDTCTDSEGFKLHDRISGQTPIDVEKFLFSNLIDEESNGGAINVENDNKVSCRVSHCKFEGCKSKNGGAIYISYNGNTTVYTCTISDSSFTNCYAATQGGALYLKNVQSGRHSIAVTGCNFTSNKAVNDGGAVYADMRDKFTLTNCNFEGNSLVKTTTNDQGFSLWFRGGWNSKYNKNSATIKNNKFIFTPINKNSINVYICAYGLYEDISPNANIEFGECAFSSTKQITGSLNLKIAEAPYESLTFTGCNCVQNDETTVSIPAAHDPVYYFKFECTDSCTIDKTPTPTPVPTQDQEGYTPNGRINRIEYQAKVLLIKAKFSNLVAEKGFYGGAIYAKNIPCSLTECKFDSCQAEYAGAVYVTYSGSNGPYKCTIMSTTFNKCNSTNGGALYVNIVQPKTHSVTIEGCTFTENEASQNGGAIYATVRDSFSVSNSVFTNNEAEGNGTSIWCRIGQDNTKKGETDNRAIIYGNKFSFTPSENNNVNVYIESNKLKEDNPSINANILLGRNTFTATGSATGYKHLHIQEVGEFQTIKFTGCNCIQGAESTVTIDSKYKYDSSKLKYNCQNIDDCPADDPALPPATEECKYSVRLDQCGGNLILEKTCFSKLAAPESLDGGAIRIINANIELEECRFTECSADGNGGAIYATFSNGNYKLEVEECVFTSCSSKANGGAIYFTCDVPTCSSSFKECEFTKNSAANRAGAFYYKPCANSKLLSCTFADNVVSGKQGSALYALVVNTRTSESSSKSKKTTKEDEKTVVIADNKVRSDPVKDTSQVYIDMKNTGDLKISGFSFSFNNAKDIPEGSLFINLKKDEGTQINYEGELCISDKEKKFINGFDSENVNIKTDCHDADPAPPQNPDEPEHDATTAPADNGGNSDGKKKNKTGMIVGIVVAVVVVIAVVVVVVIVVLRKKSAGKYVSDLNNDDIADDSNIGGVSAGSNEDFAQEAQNL